MKEGQHHKKGIARANAEPLELGERALDVRHEIAVRQHGALGLASRAGGVDDGRDVVQRGDMLSIPPGLRRRLQRGIVADSHRTDRFVGRPFSIDDHNGPQGR